VQPGEGLPLDDDRRSAPQLARERRDQRDVMRQPAAAGSRSSVRRIVITGMGAVTPLGNNVQSTWENAVAGRSGVDFITTFDTSDYPVHIAAQVKNFGADDGTRPSEQRPERCILFALSAAREALADADVNEYQPGRIGVVLGSGIGDFHGLTRQYDILKAHGPEHVSPTFLPNVLADSASARVAVALGIRGPTYAIVSACATGSHAIGKGAELLRRGYADAVLAGGTEACIHPLLFAGFCAMRGLASEDDDPSRASRPFDATRDGFVMGEGAGVVMLEELERATARGATIYAEVLGHGASNDAHHMAAPDPHSVGVAEMMRAALQRCGIARERVGYINAHGTSTPLGDAAETKAIKDVFAKHAYKLAVSSTKSTMGHLLGAAGAVEGILTVLAMRHGLMPPTINYRNPDGACDLDYVPNHARAAEIDVAVSNAMGLGGHNGCLLLGRVD
jgi:3-oxoacyl-[acyl-carrier-protein] synthase II